MFGICGRPGADASRKQQLAARQPPVQADALEHPAHGGTAQLATGRNPGVGDVACRQHHDPAGFAPAGGAIACSRWSGYSGGVAVLQRRQQQLGQRRVAEQQQQPDPDRGQDLSQPFAPGEPQQQQPGGHQQHADGGGDQEPRDELLQEEHGAAPILAKRGEYRKLGARVTGNSKTGEERMAAASLAVGKKAPDFALKNQDDKVVKLGQLSGKWVVLYFYPKDDTPGCTVEACDFTSGYQGLREAGRGGAWLQPRLDREPPALHRQAQAEDRPAVRPRPPDDGRLRRLGRKEHVRPDHPGGHPLDRDHRPRRQGRLTTGPRSRPTATPKKCRRS